MSGAIAATISPDINIFKSVAFFNPRIIRDVDFTQFSCQVISVVQPVSVKVTSGSHMRRVVSDRVVIRDIDNRKIFQENDFWLTG